MRDWLNENWPDFEFYVWVTSGSSTPYDVEVSTFGSYEAACDFVERAQEIPEVVHVTISRRPDLSFEDIYNWRRK